MQLIHWLQQPWPWYISGPLIGLMVPALLIFGNKSFGISSSLRHICAACTPANIPFFQYNWKKEIWNLFFVGGILIGAIIASTVLLNPAPIKISPKLIAELQQYGIHNYNYLAPVELFNWQTLFSLKGFIVMIAGGFLVGFGTRYAGGCTSGHSIYGLSNFQFSSFIATLCFMAGGFIMANLILPFILKM